MPDITVDMITRLPRWAQAHIRTLEMELRELRSNVEAAKPDESDTAIDNILTNSRHYLGKGTRIGFTLPLVGNRWDHTSEVVACVQVSRVTERPVLSLYAREGALSLRATSSNVFEIELDDR